MSDKTRTRRRNDAASGSHSDTPATTAERRESSIDNVLERWSFGVAKEGVADEIGVSNALLRSALALREMQIDAAKRTQATHEKAAEQLKSARSVAEVTSVGLMLAQADAEGAVRYWSEMAGIVAKGGFDGWSEAFRALTRTSGIAQSFSQHWLETMASAKPETVAAQVEHATTPVTSSPLVWPAQEAVREAMSLGARNWNEWLGSTMPAMAQAIGAATATSIKH